MNDTDSIIVPRLKRLIRNNRLPHALLFVGADKEALRTCSQECIRALNCPHYVREETCSGCESCRLLTAGNHPDVQRLDCGAFEGDAMDSLREVLTNSFRKPFLGGSRITVLDASDQLSLAALNLLLKTLEEPRPNNFYILTTPSASLLPATILSRSQVWFFPDNIAAMPALPEEQSQTLATEVLRIAKGEMHAAVLLATKIHKEFKDQIALVLATLQRTAREQLLSNESPSMIQRWAVFLSDLCELEHTIGTRNFNSQYQLVWAFERLARAS